MKAQTIPAKELDKFMKVFRIETEVRVEMQQLLDLAELQLKKQQSVANKLEYIKNFKGDYKLSKEVKEMFYGFGIKNITITNLRKALGIEKKKEKK